MVETTPTDNRSRWGVQVSEPDRSAPQRGDLEKLIRMFADDRGVDLGHYRRSYLERRLGSRLRSLGLATYRQYAERLERDPDEYAQFMQVLTINFTDFFRDPDMWDVLRTEVIPAIIAEKNQRHGRVIRVWSAGCATGEEAYSLAMSFLDVLGEDAERYTLSVHGTDLDPDALEVAERGVYGEERIAHVAPRYLERFFEPPSGDGASRRVNADVRRLVRFRSFSLFDTPPMKLVDLVMCRNVFIYLNREEQTKVLDAFWGATMSGGYLVLGRSEKLSAGVVARFEPVNSKERIFQKPART